eukprot:4885625-Pyramimonas_sp.AAC.1
MLTRNTCLGAQCTIGLGYCCGLCDSFNAYLAYHLFTRVIRRFRRPFVIQDRCVKEHCWLPSKQGAAWRHLAVEGARAGGKQDLMQ